MARNRNAPGGAKNAPGGAKNAPGGGRKARGKNAPAKDMKPFYMILALIAVVGIGAIVYSMNRNGDMATEPLDMAQIDDAQTLLDRAQGISLGDPNAPVRVLVFSDFQCNACAVWNRIEQNLKAEFVETGKVHYTYYDFPIISIHPHAFLAARAGRCALDQGRFWEFHDRMFAGQNTWAFSQSPPVDTYAQFAGEVGLDVNAFTQCVRSDTHADVVTASRALGMQLGVGGTPTVFVGQRRLGGNEWSDYAAVRAAIQAAGGV